MDLSTNIKNTLIRLCKIKSTSNTDEEAEAASKIYSIISEINYFRENPGNLILHDIDKDPYERKFVSALYSPQGSKKIVVLLSHFDVVGLDGFGHLSRYALDPLKYTEALKSENLPDDVKDDLKSGDWLFGRGTADMKCGLAIHIELLRYLYENGEDIGGSVLLLTVPDEENASAGMLSAVEYLSYLKSSGYEITAVINSEPSFQEYPGDENAYIYTGTCGKLLLTLCFEGVESHAGSPFNGISSSLMSSVTTSLIEANTELCETWGSSIAPPPVCLKQQDVKELYSVTTPSFSYAHYNYMTLASKPQHIIERIKNVCSSACKIASDKLKDNSLKYASLSGTDISFPEMKFNILTCHELEELLKCRNINIDNIKNRYEGSTMDIRDMTAAIVHDMLNLLPELRPAVIISLSPPYYPHRTAAADSKVSIVCREVIERSHNVHNMKLLSREFFPGICDLSYLGFDDQEDILSLKSEMPVLGSHYKLPLDAISALGADGINISVIGRDIHKYTERLNMPYSFKVTPDLVLYAIKRFLS